jgi:chorismate synthase
VIQLGPHRIPDAAVDFDAVYSNPLFAASSEVVPAWEAYLDGVRKAGSSIGAVVGVEITGVPAGWGAPLYAKLDAELAAAMMSINAVKGVEIGEGFAAAALSGEENADEMRLGPDGQPVFLSNHAGGILGGISTGQPITLNVAFKPTSSILALRQTVTRDGTETDLRTKGRHDPCVALRGVPVVEAMAACVLADAMLRHRAQVG